MVLPMIDITAIADKLPATGLNKPLENITQKDGLDLCITSNLFSGLPPQRR